MKNQTFGVEIELTGLTRMRAAEVVAEHFGTIAEKIGDSYDTCQALDPQGRTWKLMSDGSIRIERKSNQPAEAVELVTPILKYEDIETLQDIIRKLRAAGAIANNSCGIHVHVGAEKHTAKTLKNLVNIMTSKQDLIYRALNINSSRENYCKKLENSLTERFNEIKPETMDKLADIWYYGYSGDRSRHYHNSRYHGLNLHSVFTKGTVEFRLFNSTTHAGKIKSYIQFCLAVNHQALTQKTASARVTTSDNEKYTFRTWLLRLGLIGEEFETARKHLLANLDGNIAWRHAA